MARYYLEDRIIYEAYGDELSHHTPEMIYHLAADGIIREVSQAPALGAGEGLLMVAGEFHVDPLEVQVEFIKAANAEKWLEGLLQRHTERVRTIAGTLWVLAEMREVSHEP